MLSDYSCRFAPNIDILSLMNSTPKTQASSRAIAAFILGLLSVACLGIFAAVPAMILGFMELKAIKAGQAPKEGELITKIGLILGIIVTALTFIVLLALSTISIIPVIINQNVNHNLLSM